MYVTIVHILVLQSDSGFGSHSTPPTELEDNVNKLQPSVYYIESAKERWEIHGDTKHLVLIRQDALQGLISRYLSVDSEVFLTVDLKYNIHVYIIIV